MLSLLKFGWVTPDPRSLCRPWTVSPDLSTPQRSVKCHPVAATVASSSSKVSFTEVVSARPIDFSKLLHSSSALEGSALAIPLSITRKWNLTGYGFRFNYSEITKWKGSQIRSRLLPLSAQTLRRWDNYISPSIIILTRLWQIRQHPLAIATLICKVIFSRDKFQCKESQVR